MLSFYEFSNKLDEAGGGRLSDLLKQAGIGQKPEPTAEPTPEPTPEPQAIAPQKQSLPTSPEPKVEPPRRPAKVNPEPAQGIFANPPIPGAEGDDEITNNPVGGPGRISASRQLDRGFNKTYGRTDYGSTPSLNRDPAIIDYKKKYPELSQAFDAIDTPFRRSRPFTMLDIVGGDASGEEAQAIQKALDIMRADKEIYVTNREGRTVYVPLSAVNRPQRLDLPREKGDLGAPTPEEEKSVEDDMRISPRLPSLRDKVAAKPKIGTGPKAPTEAPKRALSSPEKMAGKLNALKGIMDNPRVRNDDKFAKYAQDLLDSAWIQLDDMEKEAQKSGDKQVLAATAAWKREVDAMAQKAGLRSSTQKETTEWLEYYCLMETYRPSAVR